VVRERPASDPGSGIAVTVALIVKPAERRPAPGVAARTLIRRMPSAKRAWLRALACRPPARWSCIPKPGHFPADPGFVSTSDSRADGLRCHAPARRLFRRNRPKGGVPHDGPGPIAAARPSACLWLLRNGVSAWRPRRQGALQGAAGVGAARPIGPPHRSSGRGGRSNEGPAGLRCRSDLLEPGAPSPPGRGTGQPASNQAISIDSATRTSPMTRRNQRSAAYSSGATGRAAAARMLDRREHHRQRIATIAEQRPAEAAVPEA